MLAITEFKIFISTEKLGMLLYIHIVIFLSFRSSF